MFLDKITNITTTLNSLDNNVSSFLTYYVAAANSLDCEQDYADLAAVLIKYVSRGNAYNAIAIYQYALYNVSYPPEVRKYILIELSELLIKTVQYDFAYNILLLLEDSCQDLFYYHKVRFLLSTYYFSTNNVNKGFLYLTSAHHVLNYPYLKLDIPNKVVNNISQLKDKSVLIVSEFGLGDEIINLRYLNQFIDTANVASVSFISMHQTQEIMHLFRIQIESQPLESCYKNYDCVVFLQSIPVLLDLHAIPPTEYLNVPRKYLSNKINIGYKLSGVSNNLPVPHDIISASNNNWVSLDINDLYNNAAYQFNGTVYDLAVIINSMDIIITADTSIAHIASSLRKPTIIFVPSNRFYVYASGQLHTSWYTDNTYLLYQTDPLSWQEQQCQLPALIDHLIHTNYGSKTKEDVSVP